MRGRVQGVGFRYFVVREARRLGLAGYARNETDGSVEIRAEGPELALRGLLDAVTRGPSGSRIDDVEVAWSSSSGSFEGFEVRF